MARPQSSRYKEIGIEELKDHFDKPMNVAAQKFDICVTALKKICRRHGIARWPHRKVLISPSEKHRIIF